MNDQLKTKLMDLPKEPGVYFHKNIDGEIIYVGKAAVLKNRVKQYFHKNNMRDPKTTLLVSEIHDTDWMVVDSELEALFLEAEMVRRYMPKYNILLRDDKSMVYIRINYNDDYPTVTTTRSPIDDGASYYGPYLSSLSVRQALKILRRIFPYATKKIGGQKRATLHYHLGLDPGLEEGKTSLADYRSNLRKLIAVIEGRRKDIEKEIEKDMKQFAKNSQFEQAAYCRNQLFALRRLSKQVVFGDKEFMDISKDHAIEELVQLLGLKGFPKRIEGYDISHMQGSDVVASMVVFTNGASNKSEYRKFKTLKDQNNDFYNMHETITRRFSTRNVKKWGLPDIVLIDGGKGQLESATRARDEMQQSNIPFIGLAKREEQIVIRKTHNTTPHSNVVLNVEYLHKLGGYSHDTDDYILVNLPGNTNVIKLLQRIRDESHRFAVSYHTVLKRNRQTASLLDDIPGIGPATKKKLLKNLGSLKAVINASQDELSFVIGPKKAHVVYSFMQSYR